MRRGPCLGLWPVPGGPIPGLCCPQGSSSWNPNATGLPASLGVTRTLDVTHSPWKKLSPAQGLLPPSHQTKPPAEGMRGKKP